MHLITQYECKLQIGGNAHKEIESFYLIREDLKQRFIFVTPPSMLMPLTISKIVDTTFNNDLSATKHTNDSKDNNNNDETELEEETTAVEVPAPALLHVHPHRARDLCPCVPGDAPPPGEGSGTRA